MNKNFSVLLVLILFASCSRDADLPVNQEVYTLPGTSFFPEGIAFQPATSSFYTGSTLNGDILQVNVTNGATRLFAGGATQGRSFTTGLKWDGRARLWACGGPENKIYALSKEGNLLKSWDTKALFNSGFINDCVTDNQYMYFTDSRVQKVYRSVVNGNQPGDPQEWLTFTNQQVPYTATGTNANGIELTPGGKYLIIVVSSSGKLYRIHTATKVITEIQLNTPVTSGDGLVLDGTKLYVSRNATGQVFPVTLDADYTSGIVGVGFGNNLLFNTTMVKIGKYLLVVNGQLNRRPDPANPANPTPVLPFTVSRLIIP